MAPSSPIFADSLPSSTAPETMENIVQVLSPFLSSLPVDSWQELSELELSEDGRSLKIFPFTFMALHFC